MILRMGLPLLCIALFPCVLSADWSVESILPSGQIVDTSLAFQSDNAPVIAFCEEGVLRIAFWRENAWEVEDVVTGGNVKVCNLVLDSTGSPLILYSNTADFTVHLAEWNGAEWTDTLIAGEGEAIAGPYCDACIDSQDNLMIAYPGRSPEPGLWFAGRQGSEWTLTAIDRALISGYTVSMDIGENDLPQVAYFDQGTGDLKYAVREATFWNVETVDSEGIVGDMASIAVDSRNLPHISYIDRTIGKVKYAHYDGIAWNICTVDSTGDPFGLVETSIQVTSDDQPMIVYYDLSDSKLKCSYYDDPSWTYETVDENGHSSSLALDREDHPWVSFFRYSYNRWSLMYGGTSSAQNDTLSSLMESSVPPHSESVTTLPDGMEFVTIPSGSFTMGSPSDEPGRRSDEQEHRVTVDSFEMMTTEVTQEMWEELMGSNPSLSSGENLPVECVSWNACQELLNILNGMGHEWEYRLPTEAEWEYACRAGTDTPYHCGDSMDDLYSSDSSGHPYPVGVGQPNAWGLYDMHGNVQEWCQDVYTGDYADCPMDGSPYVGDFPCRVIRGGSWALFAENCRSAYRAYGSPDNTLCDIGFRIARSTSNP